MPGYEYILIALSLGNLLAMIVGGYKLFNDPDNRADKQLGINKVACEEKHKRIDEILAETKEHLGNIDKSLILLKDNDIKHIEQNTYGLNEKMASLEGKMDIMANLMKEVLNKKI